MHQGAKKEKQLKRERETEIEREREREKERERIRERETFVWVFQGYLIAHVLCGWVFKGYLFKAIQITAYHFIKVFKPLLFASTDKQKP